MANSGVTGGAALGSTLAANKTLSSADNGHRFTLTTSSTITVPSAATLGPDFACEVLADGAAPVISRPGPVNTTLASGQLALVFTANGKSWVSVSPAMTGV